MCGRFAQVQTCSDYLDMLASDLEFASVTCYPLRLEKSSRIN